MAEADPDYWAKRAFDRADDATEKQVEQTNQASVLALRSILILNGGASLALLSFLANTIKGDMPAEALTVVAHATQSLVAFAWGAFFAVLATAVAYITSRLELSGHLARSRHPEEPYVRLTPRAKRMYLLSDVVTILALLCGLGSLGLFIWGLSVLGVPTLGSPAPAG